MNAPLTPRQTRELEDFLGMVFSGNLNTRGPDDLTVHRAGNYTELHLSKLAHVTWPLGEAKAGWQMKSGIGFAASETAPPHALVLAASPEEIYSRFIQPYTSCEQLNIFGHSPKTGIC